MSLPSAAAPKADHSAADEIDDALEKINYEYIGSIILTFDKPKEMRSNGENLGSLPANSVKNRRNFKVFKQKYTLGQVSELKKCTKFNVCAELSHWDSDPECKKSNNEDNQNTKATFIKSKSTEHSNELRKSSLGR